MTQILAHHRPFSGAGGSVAAGWLYPLALTLLVASLPPSPASGQPSGNDCSDPYWADTLRCAAFPGMTPQPTPAPPATPAKIKDFTRVDLSDWQVRCLDGTRPILYVDRAVGPPSDRWLISFTGGGACSARDSDATAASTTARGVSTAISAARRGRWEPPTSRR